MKKVELRMDQEERYQIIKKVYEKGMSVQSAAVRLGRSTRTVYRLVQEYEKRGKESFIHGNTGRKPSHSLSEEEKARIIKLYNTHYWDTNFVHCSELMKQHDGISISPSCLRKLLLNKAYILSPRATRKVRRRTKALLKEEEKKASSKKEKKLLKEAIIAVHDAHPRRPRCSHFGEMIQMDASVHLWFGEEKAHLHLAIDDCTGMIVAAYFDTQETLKGYYHVLYQILNTYGIPALFYTDNRTVFEYRSKQKKDVSKDTLTQFSYACNQLGIQIKTTSIPQAKGRVERAFQTLQARLPVELRLAGITDIREANVFLNSYVKEYNAKFSLPLEYNKSVFVKQPTLEKIHLILAVLMDRVVDYGHCIRFNNSYYRLLNLQGIPVYFHKGTKGMVIRTFTDELFFTSNERVYAMEEVPQHELTSRNFDFKPVDKTPKKHYIPPMSHPWKRESFLKYVAKSNSLSRLNS